MYSIQKKLKKSFSKNLPELLALKKKLYPHFVYESNPKTLKDEIPVFTLHSVYSNKFEAILQFLYKNGYRTLVADELYECLTGSKPIPERAVVLTFDDGWKNLHTVVYPLLKKYGMNAVCFLISGLISLENDDKGKIKMGKRGLDSDVLCSWKDVKEMHTSGVIDFQSHSMYHKLIFISPDVEDFFYTAFDSFAMNLNVPSFDINGEENISREIKLGTPIYKHASRFLGKNRYFDDENLRNECINFVKLNGGEEFFYKNGWRKILLNLVKEYRLKNGDIGCVEDEENLRNSLFTELVESKLMIEKNLPGKTVNHFCYPWWEGSDLAVEISKKTGYLTNFWGILSERRTNRCGDDPYRIARILSEDYIFRLPGEGRKSFLKIIQEKFSNNINGFKNRIIQQD
jgi:hypothetical protein